MKTKILVTFLCLISFKMTSVEASVIGTFPELGSAEEKADITQLLIYQNTRTKAQCDAAQSQAKASLEAFFGGRDGPLSPAEIKKATEKLKSLARKTIVEVFYYKKKYRRPRPYVTHPEIKPCIELENSTSYPSGHTALAIAYGEVLSVMFPERKIYIMASAMQATLNRMIGGVHHPSDVAAGIKLGDYIAKKYLDTDGRRYDLERFND